MKKKTLFVSQEESIKPVFSALRRWLGNSSEEARKEQNAIWYLHHEGMHEDIDKTY